MTFTSLEDFDLNGVRVEEGEHCYDVYEDGDNYVLHDCTRGDTIVPSLAAGLQMAVEMIST